MFYLCKKRGGKIDPIGATLAVLVFEAIALFIVKQDGKLEIMTDQHQPTPLPGQKVIGLVDQKTLELDLVNGEAMRVKHETP